MDDLLAEIDRKRRVLEENEITSRGDIIEREKDTLIREKAQKAKDELFSNQQNSNNLAVTKIALKSDEKNHQERLLPREEVIIRLRAKNLPIRLFGETDADSCHRLRLSEIMEREESKGLTNEFQDALEKIDQAMLMEHYNYQSLKEFSVIDCQTTLEGIKENAKMLGKTDDNSKDCELMLSIWARDLNKRPMDVKLTLEANDAYLQMAIGNAPWPIGVTMVGIHARTGREHVLNDETQRKYIQGVKRLMSYCQKTYPADPSKSVEYGALDGRLEYKL